MVDGPRRNLHGRGARPATPTLQEAFLASSSLAAKARNPYSSPAAMSFPGAAVRCLLAQGAKNRRMSRRRGDAQNHEAGVSPTESGGS